MSRERIAAFAIRAITFIYAVASLAFAVRLVTLGTGSRLPASLDPSLVVSPLWTAIGTIAQGIVVCAFLTAVAESLTEGVDEHSDDTHHRGSKRASKPDHSLPSQLVESTEQAIA